MKTGLKAKFLQYPEAKHLLLSTGHKRLVHHCNDTYWGDGLDENGQNMLGNFLMDIRKELQEKDSDVRYVVVVVVVVVVEVCCCYCLLLLLLFVVVGVMLLLLYCCCCCCYCC